MNNRLPQIIAIGRLRDGPEAALFTRYAERIRPGIGMVELPEGRGAPGEVKRREGQALLTALPAEAFVIALDPGGAEATSERFTTLLERWRASGRPVCFLIGGAEGLDSAVLTRADHVLSLGPMTWPHFLVRAMLAEQVYRAQTISQGHPYHRAGRP